jgi:hypothetical protein
MLGTPLCPMKIKFLKNLIHRNRARTGLVLFASLISIWFALTPGAAQSKNQKRITSVQIGEASEGARVTVVSDSMLNDYEAFRRGDRFYVTIPLADFAAGKPGFRGDGFEDVQVQKVGDSVVFSFKLQPGATARVDQRSNRLDVIFSAPNRTERSSRSNAGSSRGAYVPTDGIVRVNNSQRVRPHQRDAAGPMPPDSPGVTTATRGRLATGSSSGFSSRPNTSVASNARDSSGRGSGNRLSGNTGSTTTRSGASSSASKTGSSPSGTPVQTSNYSNVPSSPTPSRYGSSPVATPSASPGYPALATSSPSPLPNQTVTTPPGLAGSQTWKNRSDLALRWVKSNRQAALVGGLLGLLLLVFLVAFLVRRRKNAGKAKRSGQTLAQPKPSADLAVNSTAVSSPVSSPLSNTTARQFVHENTAGVNERTSVAAPVASANGVRTSGIQENAERARLVQEPAFIPNKAHSAGVSPNHAWVRPSPSPGSTQDEDQEREVFEL